VSWRARINAMTEGAPSARKPLPPGGVEAMELSIVEGWAADGAPTLKMGAARLVTTVIEMAKEADAMEARIAELTK